MQTDFPRPTRRWVRLLASLAVATAGLTVGVVGSATPASACCFSAQHPDEDGFTVVEQPGTGNYTYFYQSGRVREYRNFTFYREYRR
ncbi:hypothetical protein ACFFMN_28685 [Planobispora siamensis]|uniref:Secreted protein n=1 Tax=Planobispora siamensis TaxID=936338 RepID=A0A8J3WPP4_9ACTN|nr:hypothetical protein [Planobispora siamensis]GIH97458.1 hypothetical protein Psi01_80880 [Planobispora siamensis]